MRLFVGAGVLSSGFATYVSVYDRRYIRSLVESKPLVKLCNGLLRLLLNMEVIHDGLCLVLEIKLRSFQDILQDYSFTSHILYPFVPSVAEWYWCTTEGVSPSVRRIHFSLTSGSIWVSGNTSLEHRHQTRYIRSLVIVLLFTGLLQMLMVLLLEQLTLGLVSLCTTNIRVVHIIRQSQEVLEEFVQKYVKMLEKDRELRCFCHLHETFSLYNELDGSSSLV